LAGTLIIAAAVCAQAATIARFVGRGERRLAATPGAAATAAAPTPAPSVEPTETPSAAPAPSAAAAPAFAPTGQRPRPYAAGRYTRAPVRAPPPEPTAEAETRPMIRVVPSLPPLPPPDMERTRQELEPKVWKGEASIEEIRMLKAVCSVMGDRGCRDRAAAMLRKQDESPPDEAER
jgi:hypothetical protein